MHTKLATNCATCATAANSRAKTNTAVAAIRHHSQGSVLDKVNTVKAEHLQWKAEVLENRRGNLAKTTAWLVLQEEEEPEYEDDRMHATWR